MTNDLLPQYLFVYGTLMRSADNRFASLLHRQARFVEQATFQGKLYQAHGFPAAVPSSSADQLVHGEVFRLDRPDVVLPVIDDYEECSAKFAKPTLYHRQIVSVCLASGTRLRAWIYLYNRTITGPCEMPEGLLFANTAAKLVSLK